MASNACTTIPGGRPTRRRPLVVSRPPMPPVQFAVAEATAGEEVLCLPDAEGLSWDEFLDAGPSSELVRQLSAALDAASSEWQTLKISDGRLVAEQQEAHLGDLTPGSMGRYFDLWFNFERFAMHSAEATVLGDVTPELVRHFVECMTTGGRTARASTRRLRLVALRRLFQTLRGLRMFEGDPTLDMVIPSDAMPTKRPLSDKEVEICEFTAAAAIFPTRDAAVWALAEAGACTAEIADVTAADVDFEKRRVWLAGSPKTFPRWVPLTDWGVAQLGRRAGHLRDQHDDGGSLTYLGDGDQHSKRTSSLESIKYQLIRAGLGDDRSVDARSVNAWAARRAYERDGRIESAAYVFGMVSMDKAAGLIGYNWLEQ